MTFFTMLSRFFTTNSSEVTALIAHLVLFNNDCKLLSLDSESLKHTFSASVRRLFIKAINTWFSTKSKAVQHSNIVDKFVLGLKMISLTTSQLYSESQEFNAT